MALQMPFTDASGHVAAQSYWKVVSIAIERDGNPSARITFKGYRNAASSTTKRPLIDGEVTFVCEGDEFRTLWAAHIAPGGPDILKACYKWVKDRAFEHFAGAVGV